MKSKRIDVKKEDQALLVFLAMTKGGKYAQIEESSIPYARLEEERENIEIPEEEYSFTIA